MYFMDQFSRIFHGFWTDFLFRDIPIKNFQKRPPFFSPKNGWETKNDGGKGEPTRIVPVRLFDAHPAFKAARPWASRFGKFRWVEIQK